MAEKTPTKSSQQFPATPSLTYSPSAASPSTVATPGQRADTPTPSPARAKSPFRWSSKSKPTTGRISNPQDERKSGDPTDDAEPEIPPWDRTVEVVWTRRAVTLDNKLRDDEQFFHLNSVRLAADSAILRPAVIDTTATTKSKKLSVILPEGQRKDISGKGNCRYFALPNRVRFYITRLVVKSHNTGKPVRMNSPTFLDPIWPVNKKSQMEPRFWSTEYFEPLETVLDSLVRYTSVCFAMRVDFLTTMFLTRRFHVVYSPFVTDRMQPAATLYMDRFGPLMKWINVEVDLSKMAGNWHPSAAELNMDATLKRVKQGIERFTDRQLTRHDEAKIQSLVILVRRYYGYRPGTEHTITAKVPSPEGSSDIFREDPLHDDVVESPTLEEEDENKDESEKAGSIEVSPDKGDEEERNEDRKKKGKEVARDPIETVTPEEQAKNDGAPADTNPEEASSETGESASPKEANAEQIKRLEAERIKHIEALVDESLDRYKENIKRKGKEKARDTTEPSSPVDRGRTKGRLEEKGKAKVDKGKGLALDPIPAHPLPLVMTMGIPYCSDEHLKILDPLKKLGPLIDNLCMVGTNKRYANEFIQAIWGEDCPQDKKETCLLCHYRTPSRAYPFIPGQRSAVDNGLQHGGIQIIQHKSDPKQWTGLHGCSPTDHWKKVTTAPFNFKPTHTQNPPHSQTPGNPPPSDPIPADPTPSLIKRRPSTASYHGLIPGTGPTHRRRFSSSSLLSRITRTPTTTQGGHSTGGGGSRSRPSSSFSIGSAAGHCKYSFPSLRESPSPTRSLPTEKKNRWKNILFHSRIPVLSKRHMLSPPGLRARLLGLGGGGDGKGRENPVPISLPYETGLLVKGSRDSIGGGRLGRLVDRVRGAGSGAGVGTSTVAVAVGGGGDTVAGGGAGAGVAGSASGSASGVRAARGRGRSSSATRGTGTGTGGAGTSVVSTAAGSVTSASTSTSGVRGSKGRARSSSATRSAGTRSGAGGGAGTVARGGGNVAAGGSGSGGGGATARGGGSAGASGSGSGGASMRGGGNTARGSVRGGGAARRAGTGTGTGTARGGR